MVTRIVAAQAARPAAGKVRKARKAAGSVPSLGGERMSRVDTAWLRMDSPANLMMIVGVWVLRPGVSHSDLCERISQKLLAYPRFRQAVHEDAAGASWVEQTVDIQAHVLREKLPRHRRGQAKQALQRRVGDLAMQPLDRSRPLWQMHLVEDYEGGSALIARIHHCIADGIALISVMMSLVDGGAAVPQRRMHPASDQAEDWIADTLVRPLAGLAVRLLGHAGDGAARSIGLLRDPHKGVLESVDAVRLGLQVATDALSLLTMPDDSPTRLKGKPGCAKRVAWCPPLPLDEVKAIGKALNCSVNDVLMSCAAGAIGSYLRQQGDNVQGVEIRAMVPVNLRPLDQAHKLGNRFGLAPLLLPVGMDHPIERLYEVRRRMNALKGSSQPMLAFLLLAVAGLMVKPVQDLILHQFSRKTTAVMTNVPGPRDKLRFLGSTLEQTMFWVPQSGDVGLGVSVLSYGGSVQFGVIGDSQLCPDPQQIIDGFEPEFARLSLVTLMLPWGEQA